MRLSDLLTEDLVAVPVDAGDLRETLDVLFGLLEESGLLEGTTAAELSEGLASGRVGQVIRVNPDVLLVAARAPALDDLSVALGIARTPFRVLEKLVGESRGGEARAVFLLLTPRRLSTLKLQVIPTLTRILRDEERSRRLLAAGSSLDVRAFQELMETELHERLVVEDVMTPLSYRIYPDTPLSEVVDLMVRRHLRAVPVVGERLEVLGIITNGDILSHLLPRRRAGEDEEGQADQKPLLARDVMTRTVMCVSEDQSLLEAANLLVNKDVEQVPVVREGEMVGFLNRDTILKTLFGR